MALNADKYALPDALENTDLATVDWNLVLRTVNTAHDRFLRILREPDPDRLPHTVAFLDTVNSLPTPGSRVEAYRQLGEVYDGPSPGPKHDTPAETLTRLHDFLTRRPNESTADFSTRISAYFVQSDIRSLDNPARRDLMTRTFRRLHILALAALLHHATTGHFPQSLDDLHLPNDITTDPFSNQPFFCVPADNALTLYSVGPNRTNDHGTPRRPLNDPTDDLPLHLQIPISPK